MTASEEDITRDINERNNLQNAISDLETAIAVSIPGTRRILELSLAGAKAQVSALDKKIAEAKVERAAEVQAQAAAAAALAAKETKLSAEERETYRGFLEKSYFTKKDFGKLDEFYSHSYDRLSEGGKEEMSKRIDEGIKRGEFKAAELPDAVRKRLAEPTRLSAKTQNEVGHSSNIDASNNASEKLPMGRESLKQPVSLSAPSNKKEIDLGSVDLSGIKLVDATTESGPASIPDASGQRTNVR